MGRPGKDQITADSGIDEKTSRTEQDKDSGSITTGPSTEGLKRRWPLPPDQDHYFASFEVKKQKINHYIENIDYKMLNNKVGAIR